MHTIHQTERNRSIKSDEIIVLIISISSSSADFTILFVTIKHMLKFTFNFKLRSCKGSAL